MADAPPPSYTDSTSAIRSFEDPYSAYSPESVGYTAPATQAAVETAAGDDSYAFLSQFDTIFLIDDSGSMAGRSWRETAAAIRSIAPICTARDKDGIDIHFLNAPDCSEYWGVKTPGQVEAIFSSVRPYGGTPTGTRLHQILKPYLQNYEARPNSMQPLNIIVITDGVPSDDVESVLVNVAKKLDRLDAPAWQVGVQFFQVGQEPGAAEALRELDDGLAELGGVRDMVDTVPWAGVSSGNYSDLNADAILKVVLGAVNRRLDRKVLRSGRLQR
ncbi:hypothetical protein L228DRAFT_208827 [Xylona heveae TC161]|uniref:VWFA domain-containing protein n=1 Tax=Xylona heveae (strain CBS 132557 / TC161) TaxID=1328760 RepID=A0A165HUD2_XYLHT|nr:hypothetical protein L228DRAFT_208827 [Xylona heveae TC161]KZF23938.1 hypothetical protein L228DRAFT_208827 [Xylona heveae TC161]